MSLNFDKRSRAVTTHEDDFVRQAATIYRSGQHTNASRQHASDFNPIAIETFFHKWTFIAAILLPCLNVCFTEDNVCIYLYLVCVDAVAASTYRLTFSILGSFCETLLCLNNTVVLHKTIRSCIQVFPSVGGHTGNNTVATQGPPSMTETEKGQWLQSSDMQIPKLCTAMFPVY